MKRGFFLLASFLCLAVPGTVYASSVKNLLEYSAESQEITVDYTDKSVEVNDKATTLQSELGISNTSSSNAIQNALEDAGYIEDSKSGREVSYRNRFENKRLIVKGNPSSDNIDKASFVGWTILQYASIEETITAYEELTAKRYKVVPDVPVKFTANKLNGESSVINQGAADMNLNFLQTIGENDVTVAVLDTGFNYSSYFNNRVLDPINFSSEPDSSDTWKNGAGHGTEVASVIVDATSEHVKILPLKVLSADGVGTQLTLVAALEYIFKNQCADIINICIGWQCNTTDEAVLCDFWDEIIKKAMNDYQIPVIVASGNEGTKDTCYPACLKEVWTVGSVGDIIDGSFNKDTISYFSNYGSVDFVSRGYQVDTVNADGVKAVTSGTSVSAPLITSLAAGYKSAYQYDTCDELYGYIKELCVDLGDTGYDEYYGWGLPVYSDGSGNPCSKGCHFVETSVSAATCVAKEKHEYECSRCEKIKTEEIGEVNPDKHTGYSFVVTDATCLEPSYKVKKCKGCGKEISKTEFSTALGHDMSVTGTYEEISSDEKYIITYEVSECSRCDERTVKEVNKRDNPDYTTTEVSTEVTTTERPSETPIEKPTEVPTEATTEKVTEKPTERPTEQPTEKPTEIEMPTEAATTEKTTEAPKKPEKVIPPKKTKISSLKNKSKKSLYIRCSKVKGCKYVYQIATNKKFKKASTKKSSKYYYTWKKLKKGKKYYVRVRTYKTVRKKVYYSPWSKYKTIRIRK